MSTQPDCASHNTFCVSRFALPASRHLRGKVRLALVPAALLVFLVCASAVAQPPSAIKEPTPRKAQDPFAALIAGTFMTGVSLAVVLLVAVPLGAFAAALTLVRPALSDRLNDLVAHRRSSAFWWGLAATALCLFAFVLLSKAKPLGGLAVLLSLLYAWVLLVGFAGVARQSGELLVGSVPSLSSNPPLLALVGGLFLCALMFVPVFGCLFALYIACLSVGAFRLGWRGQLPSAQRQHFGQRVSLGE